VAPDRLPAPIADRLVRRAGSLGRLLAARGAETHREILQITLVRAGSAADHLGVQPSAALAAPHLPDRDRATNGRRRHRVAAPRTPGRDGAREPPQQPPATRRGGRAVNDHARFWLWIALLALTCLLLGAALSAAVAGAQAGHDGCHHSIQDARGSHTSSL
jgi:hypothetical protein